MKKRSLETAITRTKKNKHDDNDDEQHTKEKHDMTILSTRCDDNVPLYVLRETFQCAFGDQHGTLCDSCLHKIASQNKEDVPVGTRPNVRPEQCPRFFGNAGGSTQRMTTTHCGIIPLTAQLSNRTTRVLTVGDGDFTFSHTLVESGLEVVATSLHCQDELEKSYSKEIRDTIKAIRNGPRSRVKFQVDAKSMSQQFKSTTTTSTWHAERDGFDVIVFNFPAVPSHVRGSDAQLSEIEANRTLLECFGVESAALLKPTSSSFVIITHKTIASFGKDWNVVESMCKSGGLVCIGAVVFDRCAYPGYRPRKALDKKGFPTTDAVQYLFALAEYDDGKILTDITKPVTRTMMDACLCALLQAPVHFSKS